jgi:transposase
MMLAPGTRVRLRTTHTDMRCGFDSLAGIVRSAKMGDPLDGTLYVFRNKSGNRLKILYWDRDGLAIWNKRLEKGTFKFPADPASARPEDLALILGGFDPQSVKRLPRYALKTAQEKSSKKP